MKKSVYIIITSVLGLLLSFIVHAIIEVKYLDWLETQGLRAHWYGIFGKSCALPPLFNYSLFITGVLFGIWLGFIWWDLVYVKRKRGLFQKLTK